MMRFKRLVRRLIPDVVMARYRLAQHSRHSRTNLVMFVERDGDARRRVATTPDTVMVWVDPPPAPHPAPATLFGDPGRDLTGFLHPEVDAVAEAFVDRPGLVGGRRALPPVHPHAILIRNTQLEVIGTGPPDDPDSLCRRLLDAGATVGVVESTTRRSPTTSVITVPSMVIVSAVPMHDVGGGSRTAQLALELLAQGFHVTYLHLYPAAESVDLGMRHLHPHLEQYAVADFDPGRHLSRVSQPELCVVALPTGPAIEVASVLSSGGYRTVYDLIDDWSDPALGAEWYSSEREESLVGEADFLIGSAPDLVTRLERWGRTARLIPNGVNREIFAVDPGDRPHDMPDGRVIGYHGSLYGNWFDWEALEAVAVAHPEATVVVIGDIPRERPRLPANVTFLGLKPQTELPAYVGRFSVGLIPFVISDTTHAVSPLKAFEYLAMGVPVAAPPLRALAGLDGVFVADDLVTAVAAALAGPRPDRHRALTEHSWETRVRDLLAYCQVVPPEPGERARIILRPPVHHPKRDRLRRGREEAATTTTRSDRGGGRNGTRGRVR